MRHAVPATRFTRALLALACAFALALGVAGHGQARAAKAAAPQPVAIVSVAAQPCPVSAPAAICTFAGISAAVTAEEAASALVSGATSRAVLYARRDDAAPATPADDAPFRPPREG